MEASRNRAGWADEADKADETGDEDGGVNID